MRAALISMAWTALPAGLASAVQRNSALGGGSPPGAASWVAARMTAVSIARLSNVLPSSPPGPTTLCDQPSLRPKSIESVGKRAIYHLAFDPAHCVRPTLADCGWSISNCQTTAYICWYGPHRSMINHMNPSYSHVSIPGDVSAKGSEQGCGHGWVR